MTEQLKIDLGPVYLRPITLEDTENIVKWRNTDRVRKNFIYQKPFTKEGHLAWMRDKVAAGEVVQFILCETEGDRPVGSVYFRDIDTGNKKAEYGIFIGEEDAAGKGYGTLAARRDSICRQQPEASQVDAAGICGQYGRGEKL